MGKELLREYNGLCSSSLKLRDLLLPAVGVVKPTAILIFSRSLVLLSMAYGLSDLEVCIAFVSHLALVLMRSEASFASPALTQCLGDVIPAFFFSHRQIWALRETRRPNDNRPGLSGENVWTSS